MNLGAVLNTIGTLLLFLAATMLAPLAWAIWYWQEGDALSFFLSILTTAAIGAACFLKTRHHQKEMLGHKEAFAVVSLGWTIIGLFGALPYIFHGTFTNPVDAIFESISGFTTTGASVLSEIEGTPHGILFWRSLTHWLGGMGIIVLVLAVLPFLGVGGMQLFKAEAPGPVADRLHPRVSQTAKSLWKVYVLFSVVEAILLWLGPMDLFESLCHTFGTMATGGFSTRNQSIGAFDSAYVEGVIIVFMFLAGCSFTLHYGAFRGNLRGYFKDTQFLVYLGMTLFGVLALTILTRAANYDSFSEALRASLFQTVSILTTTGYGTEDFDAWLPVARILLVTMMIIGGCAGSTSGGVKTIRAMIFHKSGTREIRQLIHPRAVIPMKIGGTPVKQDVVRGVMAFFALYILCASVAMLIMSALVPDIVTAVSSVISMLGNIGPGLGDVGPAMNYAGIPSVGKLVLTLCMLLGRLEIYTVLILFSPEFWRR